MHKKFDIPQAPSESEDIEYYKSLACLAEERARNIRRIAGLERTYLEERLSEQKLFVDAYAAESERIKQTYGRFKEKSDHLRNDLAEAKAQLKVLRRSQDSIAQSRAHQLAEVYVQHVNDKTLLGWSLRFVRPFARVLSRMLVEQ